MEKLPNQPTFYDSPEEAIKEIVKIKEKISNAPPGNLRLGIFRGKRFWGKLDVASVDNGDFHGNPEKNARTLYHRLLARFLAERVYRSQFLVFVLAVILGLVGGTIHNTEKQLLESLKTNIDNEQKVLNENLSDRREKNRLIFTEEAQLFIEKGNPIPDDVIERFNNDNRFLEKTFNEGTRKIEEATDSLSFYTDILNTWGSIFHRIGQLVAFGVILVLIPTINDHILKRNHKEKKQAEDIVRRIYLRDFKNAKPPEDLKDIWRYGWITTDGRPVSSEISVDDFKTDELPRRANAWVLPSFSLLTSTGAYTGLAASLSLCILWILIFVSCWLYQINLSSNSESEILSTEESSNSSRFGIVSIFFIKPLNWITKDIPPIWTMFFGGFFGVWKRIVDRPPSLNRARELEKQVSVDAATYLMAGGYPWSQVAESARIRQFEQAQRDSSPIFQLGITAGMLAARGDLYAPSAGLPFKLSLKDLTQHLLVLGGIGSGKTAGILRPIARQAGQAEGVGLVVLDGKGALPGELKDVVKGMQIVDPRNSRVSLVKGLQPATLVDTIIDVIGARKNSADQFFTDSAADLLRKAAILAQAAGGDYWTLSSIGKIATNSDSQNDVILAIPESAETLTVGEAAEFFMEDWENTEERVKSNIIATARSWLNTITSHPDLAAWADTNDELENVDITAPLEGGRLGVLIPDYRYGRGGAVVTALIKARLYEGIKKRGENSDQEYIPVLFIMDEAQEIATKDDASLLAIGRSLKLAMVAATQTVEGVVEKLGKETSDKWFGIYGSLVGLKGRSKVTNEFIAARFGTGWRSIVENVQGVPINQSAGINTVHGVKAASLYQESCRNIEFDSRDSRELANFPWNLLKPPIFRERIIYGDQTSKMNTTIRVAPLLEAGEIEDLLAVPGTALIVATRASVTRRDVIKLNFISEDGTSFEP